MTRKIYFFTVMAVLFLLASPNLRAESSGTCGTSLTWTLNDQGVLTIKGTGAMNDFNSMSSVPWFRRPFTTVVIEEGVTTIGALAFNSCTSVTSVTIPSSVTSIGGGAFANNTGLTNVDIPNSVTSIGEDAFNSCSRLTSVTLSNSLESISAGLFHDCINLTSVDIPSSVTSIGKNAFANCASLTSVTIPSSVTSIEYGAFGYCSGLTKIESLAENPPVCGDNAFSGVDKDKCELTVPGASVDAYKDAEIWKEFTNTVSSAKVVAEGNCGDNITWTLDDQGVLTIEGAGEMSNYEYMSSPFTSLSFTKAVIKDGVTTIGEYTFAENKGMTSVEIPSSVVKIGTQAFVYCEGLKSVTIPAAVTTIGEMAFLACKGLEKIESMAENPPTCGSNAFYNVDKSKCVLTVPGASVDAYKAKDAWKEFTNIEGANSAVASGKCGDNVTWTLDGDGVLTIEGTGAMTDYDSDSAPWRELTFTKVVIKDGVTTIGTKAFIYCDELTSVDIPSTVTSIGESAFSECEGLTSVTIPNSVKSIGDDAFSDCTGLKSVTLSNSLTSISAGLFYNCTVLTGVEIPNSVTSIEKAAFAKCEELTSVTLSNSLTTIVENAFANCSALTSVTFPETLTSIGSCAFRYCSALTSVTIPASVTIIEKGTFLSCSGLKSVTIPNTVTNIGECAFYECEGLTSLTIPASVEGIGDEAFMDCRGLTKIESLSENPPACRNNAFSGVDKNKCVLYVPKKSVDAYKAADGWKEFTNIEGVTNIVASGNCGDNVTWKLDDDGELTFEGTGKMEGYSDGAPWKDMNVTKAVIGDGITNIGNKAFLGCTGLTSVTIPSTVKSIGEAVFYNCQKLTSVEIPDSVTSIGAAAFAACSGLTSLNIPASVTSIGAVAFCICPGLESITVDAENSTYDSRDNCNAIIETKTNTLIAGCKNTTIPSTVTSIGAAAFYYSTGLKSVTIPASVTSIGEEAFKGCTGLEKIESLAENPPVCGKDVFSDVDKQCCPKYFQ